MKTVTRSEVMKLVDQLPESKLSVAHTVLTELVKEKETPTGESPQAAFMRLPLRERRRILAEQAKQMVKHYERTKEERDVWQSGDFLDEY